jgi:pyrimidine operon attenuation protein/uracil phosphoribosyltransferase
VPRVSTLGAPSPLSVEAATVVLVDDVIHTGRTLRAALDLLADHGRPAAVEPLVLIDRGRRELPLRATYVGRNLPVAAGAWVEVVWEPSGAGAWLVGEVSGG